MRTWHRWCFFRHRSSSGKKRRLGPWAGSLVGVMLALLLIGQLELQPVSYTHLIVLQRSRALIYDPYNTQQGVIGGAHRRD